MAYLTAASPNPLKLSNSSSAASINSYVSSDWYYLYNCISFNIDYTTSINVLLITIAIGSIFNYTFTFLSEDKFNFTSIYLLMSFIS